jgi:sugar/nucleoside kinase (ribokinase family)
VSESSAFPSAPGALVEQRTDVVCIGHAIVDRLAHVNEGTIEVAGVEPGAMTLVDGNRIAGIAELVDGWLQVAGGSAANTATGLASLGSSPVFVGSVGRDPLGAGYDLDLAAVGVRCELSQAADDRATGQCLVLVTADSRRTMATSLGAGVEIDVEAVERAGVSKAAVLYLEGYLLDSPGTYAARERAVEIAKSAGVLVALSLSDPFLVDRYDGLLNELVDYEVDLLFANEEEAQRLTGADDLGGALDALSRPGLMAAVTLGSKGAVLLQGNERAWIEAYPVERVDDTTGAGDLFAAGFLHGIVRGAPLETAGRLGAIAAGEVISHLGAQPRVSLRSLAAEAGLVEPW